MPVSQTCVDGGSEPMSPPFASNDTVHQMSGAGGGGVVVGGTVVGGTVVGGTVVDVVVVTSSAVQIA